MIVTSDNGAKQLLQESIPATSLDRIFTDLQIPIPNDDSYVISPRHYSLFFRVLYSGTYLDKALSEQALQLLSETTYTNGLVGDLPDGLVVAHKFGQHIGREGTPNQEKSRELHDCGIVYYKPSPYFVCIMTRGTNLEDLESSIRDVSHLIYQNVSTPHDI
jgi:beta-lactamase class A